MQNKKFCIKLQHKCYREILENSEHAIYSFIITHMKMKKMLIGAFLGIFAVAGIAVLPNQVNATDWSNPDAGTSYVSDWSQKLTWSALLDTIKNAINWILGILATIALVICLYGGFLMVTAAGDEKKYEKGLGVLKYAAIGLAIIGLSWMIVSVIFWFVNNLSKNQTQSDGDFTVSAETGEWTDFRGWAGSGSGDGKNQ